MWHSHLHLYIDVSHELQDTKHVTTIHIALCTVAYLAITSNSLQQQLYIAQLILTLTIYLHRKGEGRGRERVSERERESESE